MRTLAPQRETALNSSPFESLPTAADIEAAKHANDWLRPKPAQFTDNEPPKHQQIQGKFAGAYHALPTKETKNG